MTDGAPVRLVTPRFVLVVTCGLSYFLALTMLQPVLPRYVRDDLGRGDIAVGIAVGALAIGAIVLRLWAGRLGDTVGRRALIVAGAALVAVSTLGYGLVSELWWIVLMRLITGFGEAGFFVGAATMITDLSPPERRGEAVSYWSVAVYGGLAFGPYLGDLVQSGGSAELAFLVSAGLAGVAFVLGIFTRDVPRAPVDPAAGSGRRLWHPAALRPGTILFLGLMPLSAFAPLLPLYVDSADGPDVSAGSVFLVYGVLIMTVRLVGARIPDRLGARKAGGLALALIGSGIIVAAAVPSAFGLLAGTVVLACGMSLLYPAMLLLALTGITDSERASVVGTFSSFFDASAGLGAIIAGAVAEIAGYRGAFATSGLACVVGLLLLRRRVAAA
ncbi:MAG: MFS transporter [Actinomycetota bacterium]